MIANRERRDAAVAIYAALVTKVDGKIVKSYEMREAAIEEADNAT